MAAMRFLSALALAGPLVQCMTPKYVFRKHAERASVDKQQKRDDFRTAIQQRQS